MLNCPEDKRNALHKQVQRFNLVLLYEVYMYLIHGVEYQCFLLVDLLFHLSKFLFVFFIWGQ